MRTIDVALGERAYPIHIGRGLLDDATLWQAVRRGGHVLVVSNDVVAPRYLGRVRAALGDGTHASLVLADGEAHKTLASAERIFDSLAALGATRDATVVALGGGVIGDVAGFAAACWMRGIDLVQVPTTLLAMADSAVGGKTAVNLAAGKNLVGAFHQPRAVIADTATLATLPAREFRAGLAEIVKYGAIGDAAFFAWLEAHADALLARDEAALEHAIATSCAHKAAIVARDERESGERALLNFGHTFAHAIEVEAGYGTLLHGEAVAIGMVLAARLSASLGRATPEDAERLAALLDAFGLPTRLPPALDADALLRHMRLDKKNLGTQVRLILWRGIGRAEIVADVPADALRAVLAPLPA
jgi:3-dehydroquinate synthase